MKELNQNAIEFHRRYRGKIAIRTKIKLNSKKALSLAYTPGVSAVCLDIQANPKQSWQLTNRANQIAIVSDGTAILGLGNIGPAAGMPVMEGKSAIFKEFAGIDAIPLCITANNPEEIIRFCQQIEPSFAGINIEDIAAPACFEIMDKLEKDLNIPIFHDDQYGTAIAVLAALINAMKLTKRRLADQKIVINGAGAAGLAITNLLLNYGAKDITVLDREGAIYQGRSGLNKYKAILAKRTNLTKAKGRLGEIMPGKDIFIGVSKGNILQPENVRAMNAKPIILALANPTPEIMPDQALAAGAILACTGRSDFPNQINNALVFPGLFRGLLDLGITKVDQKIKITVAEAIAQHIKPSFSNILPNITDKTLIPTIVKAMKKAKN